LKWNAAQYLLAYADYINIFRGRAHTVKANAQASVLANKRTGLDMLIKLNTWSCIDFGMEE
jgi:hypothetical protein